ncbi:thiamine pyrophosphate-dependent enzyme [Micromonospora sp. Llam0]|uniref:thiamine pyrophosphate-dependent enzyme n=1 Tax=Micromonospora sp. Llam0 TaxID=2485143 RepID=UPI001F2F53C2|nr:thiamine pyrophosphate-dependent enzyme [Micromonospora sp. Llam0]
MAPGLPYAIAMQPAYPGRQVIAFVGDVGFAMLMAEFLTAVRHELVPAENVIRAGQAACSYSWRRPPRRSHRWMLRWMRRSGSLSGRRWR